MEYVRVEHFCTFCYGESTLKEILKSNKEFKFFKQCILYLPFNPLEIITDTVIENNRKAPY